jgi:hypothetical protein
VISFNTRSGAVTLTAGDISSALTYTPAGLGVANTYTQPNIFNGAVTMGATLGVTGVATLNGGGNIATPLTAPVPTEAGYMGVPPNKQTGAYTLVLADRGKNVHFAASGSVAIPASSALMFPDRAIIEISASSGATVTVTLNAGPDEMIWIPTGTIGGTRTLTGPAQGWLELKIVGTQYQWWLRGDWT